jgi:hypothetical protein
MKKNDSNPLEVNPLELFRLPWVMSDNAMTWMEPTRYCNMTCEGCFQSRHAKSGKPLAQVKEELMSALALRKCDAMLICGGEPLTHPDIVEIISMVKAQKVKPVIYTNGLGLDASKLKEFKKAGLFGITFHVDSMQSRPGWEGKNEEEINELRQHYADMVHEVGGMCCAFNTTIYPQTLVKIPSIVNWASKNINKVHVLTLIAIRTASSGDKYDYFSLGRKVDLSKTAYYTKTSYENLSTFDIYAQVLNALPNFRFCAFLGGTTLPDSIKWAVGNHIGTRQMDYGCIGPKTMEILQNTNHLLNGNYLAYSKPWMNRLGRSLLLFSIFDKQLRKVLKRYMFSVLKNPSALFSSLCIQTISVVQPVDVLENGERNDCDGCPNKTIWKGQLVSACRLEEYLEFGAPVTMAPKTEIREN